VLVRAVEVDPERKFSARLAQGMPPPNPALHLTGAACRLSGLHSSLEAAPAGEFVVRRWYMPYIGQIEAVSESAPIDGRQWIDLIDSHGSLDHVPPVMGINPFDRQPCEYNAPSSTARVVIGGVRVGAIGWAVDGSPVLLVDANEESVEDVAKVAEGVARRLGARFVRDDTERERRTSRCTRPATRLTVSWSSASRPRGPAGELAVRPRGGSFEH
jgi:hypothetical protein